MFSTMLSEEYINDLLKKEPKEIIDSLNLMFTLSGMDASTFYKQVIEHNPKILKTLKQKVNSSERE